MELAEEMAGQMRLPLQEYLVGILKYAILAQGKRLDKTDKYVAEFTSQNRKKVGTWKSETPKVESEEVESEEEEYDE